MLLIGETYNANQKQTSAGPDSRINYMPSEFSEESGISMTFIVNQAVDHWLSVAATGKQPAQKWIRKHGGVDAVRKELTEKGIKGLVTR